MVFVPLPPSLSAAPLQIAQVSPAAQLRQVDTQSQGLQPPPLPDLSVSTQALRLRSDRQQFDQSTEVFTAEGNVEMRFGRSILRADRMRIEVRQRRAVAEGNVRVELGNQVVQGSRLEYDFASERGVLEQASGRVDVGSLPDDIEAGGGLRNDLLNRPAPPPTQPRMIRFRADRILFTANSWRGENVRLTNDPQDPPELEVRSPVATLDLDASGQGTLSAQGGQLAFDQAFFLPLPIQLRIDRFNRQAPVTIFFDDFDREELRRGLVVQPNFELLQDPALSVVLSPQLYPQRLLGSDRGLGDGLGLRTTAQIRQGDGQVTNLLAELRGIVFQEFADRLRLQAEQVIPTGDGGRITYSYNYRQRFFNGLLGFQIVQNRIGALYNSPLYRLGDTGVDFGYQIAADYIDARGQDPVPSTTTDTNARPLQLFRLQLGTAFNRSFPIWQPATPRLGQAALRFSSMPIEQGLWLNTGLSSSQSYYSNGKTQNYFAGSVGLDAVVGQFVADTFDYTKINITYSNGFLSGASPFLFDRIITREQVVLGFLQQIYGPLRFGAQTTVDLQSGQRVNTVFTLGYDRRTYGLTVRFNPVRQTGSVELRVNEFNWGEATDTGTDVRGGIQRP